MAKSHRLFSTDYCLLSTVYSESLRDAAYEPHGVARDEQLLVGRDDVDGEARALAADEALAPRPSCASLRAGSSSTPIHSSPSQMRARTSGEFSPMPPVKTIASAPSIARQVGADVLAHAVAEDVDRRAARAGRPYSRSSSSSSRMSFVSPEMPSSPDCLLSSDVELLRRAAPPSRRRSRGSAGSMSPRARAHHQPFERRQPHRGVERVAARGWRRPSSRCRGGA